MNSCTNSTNRVKSAGLNVYGPKSQRVTISSTQHKMRLADVRPGATIDMLKGNITGYIKDNVRMKN